MCMPIDTECQLQQYFDSYIQNVKQEAEISSGMSSIGVINDKEYIMGIVDGRPVIIVTTYKKPALLQFF